MDLDKVAAVLHRQADQTQMPNTENLRAALELLRSGLFAPYLGRTTEHQILVALNEAKSLLAGECATAGYHGEAIERLFSALPEIKISLEADVDAALNGDPSTDSRDEVILAFPCIKALSYHRVAHVLQLNSVPVIPRMIAEISHSNTGIDLHPGAQIGSGCFIDHGTGVVIGGTAIVGNNVQIYQGVTLGAKSFRRDESGNLIKGEPRHPIVEDDVTIYSGATVLGRITVGKGSVIGGNVWVTKDVAPQSFITQSKFRTAEFSGYGDGI